MLINEDDYLAHYGILRKSGRYPWGSGGPEYASSRTFEDHVTKLRKEGMSDKDIATGMGTTTTTLRAAYSQARNENKQSDIAQAQRYKDKGYSNQRIAELMGKSGESQIRALLAPGAADRADVITTTANMLRDKVAEKKYLDVGAGVESQLGMARTRLDTAIAALREEGYKVHYLSEPQLGTGKNTSHKILTAPDVTWKEVYANRHNIAQIQEFSEDGGRSFLGIHPPLSISSKRIGVNYANQGGAEADGLIFVRRGVPDVSLGNSRYSQVRVMVDGTHYLKGMAIYKDDLPPGIDIVVNSPKHDTGNKHDVMKKIKDDPDNPFGSTIRQIVEVDHKGVERVTSAMNKVGTKEGSGDEGSWDKWSRNLPSQFLSKQSTVLAKSQLDMTYERRKNKLDQIMRMTNPEVRKKLLNDFAESTDSAAVHLRAAALPRQATKVILPVNTLKDTEIYAPTFNNGDRVVLVRFPHGGKFEIPELTVNNKHLPAKKLLGNIPDAVGINHKVAERLSGADFDGDTVLVIPNNSGKIRNQPPLEKLKGFDTKREYPPYDGMRTIDGGTWNAKEKRVDYPVIHHPDGSTTVKKPNGGPKQTKMGEVSNLITDMTIRGATESELARAVKHSMVVIDAEKHSLDYRRSFNENAIGALVKKYQAPYTTSGRGAASTLISRASGPVNVPNRALARASEGGPINRQTGEKQYTYTGESYVNSKGKVVVKSFKSKKLAETNDAHTLSSGQPIEAIYADHSNRLKALANQARLEMVNTKSDLYSPSAAKTYKSEVDSLVAKLRVAKSNSPLERKAQLMARYVVDAKRADNPNMDAATLKKIKFQALEEARARYGSSKQRIVPTQEEWNAIQAGAVTPSRLRDILFHSDAEAIAALATPREDKVMTAAFASRARQMEQSGYTLAEIASQLGVSPSTVSASLGKGG